MIKEAFIAFILIGAMFATTLEMSSTLDSDGKIRGKIIGHLDQKTNQPFEIYIDARIMEASVVDKTGTKIEVKEKFVEGKTILSMNVPYDYVEITYTSDHLTAKNKSLWSYQMQLGTNMNFDDAYIELKMPKGTKIIGSNGAISQSDSLYVDWEIKNITNQKRINLRTSYELLEQEGDINWLLFIFGTAVLGLGYLFFKKRNQWMEKETKNQEPIGGVEVKGEVDFRALEEREFYKMLDESEKEIVREIWKEGGKTTQAHLYLNTHIPKATLSRKIASLETKRLIQKSQKGIRNLISLTNSMQEPKNGA